MRMIGTVFELYEKGAACRICAAGGALLAQIKTDKGEQA